VATALSRTELPATIFLIGIVVIAVGVTLLFLVNSSIDAGYGYQAAVKAEVVVVGVGDSLLQLR